MALKEPCGAWAEDGDEQVNTEEHDWYPDYNAGGACGGAEGCSWSEDHCRKCGWYATECGCGCCNGLSKISAKAWRAIERRQRAQRWAKIAEEQKSDAYHAISD